MDMVTLDAREPGTACMGVFAASERLGFEPDGVEWEYSLEGSEDDEDDEDEEEDEDDEDDDEGEDENEGEGQ